tara:strand:- start:46 stop:846 length:801 start_codon:yes stop_codon:yes gene_type:complete
MITRVNNITPIINKNNSFVLGQLTADYDDGTTITSIAVTGTLIALKDGDKIIIESQEFTVGADAAITSTSITVDSVLLSKPIQIGYNIEINQENLFVQYQRKTEGTIGGMSVLEKSFGPIVYDSPSTGDYAIIGVDPTYVKILPRDFLVNDDASTIIPPLVFGDGTNTGVHVEDTSQELIATVNIPYGTIATEVTIWGSNTTKSVEVYEMNIDANGTGGTIGTGTTNGSAISIGTVAASTTNYLMIKILVSNVNHRIWGGKITLTQ